MSGALKRLGARLDTWGASARMRRFREGWPAHTSSGVAFHRTPKVQYRYCVGGAGETIVFAADPPMTLEVYEELLAVFSRRFRVVVFELPAMGFSTAHESYGFGFRESNDDIALFLRAVAGPGAILAFSCVASLAAVDIAVRYPDLCSRLALIQGGDPEAFAVWKAGRDPKGILARPIVGQVAMRQLAPKRMPDWYRLSMGRSDRIERFCACARTSFAHGAQWSLASAYQIYMDAGVGLSAPAQPMLSLWGEADRSHPPSNAHALRRLAPHARCESFADLGHTPELEDPERVFAAISSFIGG